MEDFDIKIKSAPQPERSEQPEEPQKADQSADARDYQRGEIPLSAEEKALLKDIKNFKEFQEDDVIYGKYNNAGKSLFVRLNDFFIDHSRVKLKHKSYFFHMLAVMTNAGVPLVPAVKSIAGRTESPRFRRILNTVADSCERGSNLADAMSRFSDVFDEAEIGIVKSGEATGRLDTMLFKLSGNLDKRNDLNMKLWGAAVYPISVLSVLLVVMVGMLVWVFPTLLNLLEEGGVGDGELPFATRVLIGLQGAVVNYWWLFLIIALAIYGVANLYKNSEKGGLKWDHWMLKMPLVGRLMRKVYVLRFIGLLGILIEAGVPVIKALKITGESLANRVYRLRIGELVKEVRDGKKISQDLADTEFLFPSEVIQMIGVGEQSASLGKISEKVSNQYQKEVDNTLKQVTSVFEPIMILVVGLFVALLALAIMSPIFNLNSVIS